MYGDMALVEGIVQTLQVWFASEKIQPEGTTGTKCPSGCTGAILTGAEKDEPTVSIPVISVGIPCARKTYTHLLCPAAN